LPAGRAQLVTRRGVRLMQTGFVATGAETNGQLVGELR
jgi:hypothetical protein